MVKVHRVEWFCSVEVGLVGVHVMLEFNSIFGSHKLGVLMIFFKEVVDWRLVEFSNETKGSSSNSSSSLLGETTSVVTEIIGVVFQTFSSELVKSLLSVTSSLGGSSDVTGSITLGESVSLIKLSLGDIVPEIGVLLTDKVVVSSVLVNGENSISFLDVSELLAIRSAAASNIRMVHLNSGSVSVLNLFRSSSVLNSQDLIVAFLSRHVLGHGSKETNVVHGDWLPGK
jgi:hypothetical protein